MKPVILLVDSDKETLKILKKEIQSQDWEVHLASSGEKALEKGEKFQIRLAVINLQLLDMNGYRLVLLLRELHPELKIVLTTADYSGEAEILARKMGILTYLPKPLDYGLLKKIIKKGLKKNGKT